MFHQPRTVKYQPYTDGLSSIHNTGTGVYSFSSRRETQAISLSKDKDGGVKAYWHIFQVLTKRSERLLELNQYLSWSHNIWMGVSVENSDYAFRIDHLRQTDARIKFLSFEPLLGPLFTLNLSDIDWVIAGGESGPKARPMKTEWVLEIKEQCLKANVPFFFKQWGGKNRKKSGRLLEGKLWNELPRL